MKSKTATNPPSISLFQKHCYALLMKIPCGQVTTYKALAEALHCRSYQAVGQALSANPNLIEVPCHRVVKSNGELGGYALGQERKEALLKQEGVEVTDGRIVNLDEICFVFTDN
ncbi:MGMT family protein [Thiomicrorhabdus sp. zzn3]|uniref:MGMT family protein n=1 Tax=Thiomicrorhabdus sp. zzn3 TaxID=3039775 RepID=UPI002437448E|nr:MGMT family protein [Thiomicrorhabdus sp. zzn3]MDG6777674.1 MGMT family protein [Thiomicrorhabdus sp. zzn3]